MPVHDAMHRSLAWIPGYITSALLFTQSGNLFRDFIHLVTLASMIPNSALKALGGPPNIGSQQWMVWAVLSILGRSFCVEESARGVCGPSVSVSVSFTSFWNLCWQVWWVDSIFASQERGFVVLPEKREHLLYRLKLIYFHQLLLMHIVITAITLFFFFLFFFFFFHTSLYVFFFLWEDHVVTKTMNFIIIFCCNWSNIIMKNRKRSWEQL